MSNKVGRNGVSERWRGVSASWSWEIQGCLSLPLSLLFSLPHFPTHPSPLVS